MRKQIQNYVYAISLGIVFGFVAYITAQVFHSLWDGTDAKPREMFFGAFVGAFFAFIFVRLGEALTRIYERKARHYNALIRLEHYFNYILNTLNENIFIIEHFRKVFSDEVIDRGETPLFASRLHDIPFSKEDVIDLANLTFANAVFNFNVKVAKMNNSMASTNRSYELFSSAFVDGKTNPDSYIANVKRHKERLSELQGFIEETKEDSIRLLARSRVLSKNAPFLSRIICRVARVTTSPTFEQDVASEIKVMRQEILENAQQSGERIRKAQSRKRNGAT
ncbi:MAG TPA: hypothetical protein ACFYEE_01610 [Candidatus Wujingus californicus]|uniref:hypothetical protein n=2 Tax=Candidatus Wujingus californicus TaxID=3367618 RepID=UPI0027128C54|nr:hypothetical protein [Candidatus Brocadiales bacterium]MDO8130386.1 hypothetical protein [Candidatus Brocadiales bacterium]